jgi:hypothetical protein
VIKVKEEEIYKKAIELWGKELQLIMAVEEFSELTKEICKTIRNGTVISEDMCSEIADAEIMLGQLKVLFGQDYSDSIKKRKLRRLVVKIETGKWKDWKQMEI